MIQIGNGLPPVAEDALEHLVACHDRILDRLRTLERAGENLESQPSAALDALASALRFLETSGRLHTIDEEESVFPRMRSRLGEADRQYLDSLEAQHREKERVYSEILGVASELREAITPDRAARYRSLTARLCELYRSHIDSENEVLVRLGRSCLSEDELATIRKEMRSRRV